MTNSNENENQIEQNKNKNLLISNIYEQIQAILAHDKFNLFKTKSKKKLDSKINKFETIIQKLLKLKEKSSIEIKKLVSIKKNLRISNKKLKDKLIEELKLESGVS